MRGVTGYTYGLFDLFHVGHLTALREARRFCDRLVVGVLTDELVERNWGLRPFIPLIERLAIIESVRFVDSAVPVDTHDLRAAHAELGFEVLFAAPADTGHPPASVLEAEVEGTGVRVVPLERVPLPEGAVLRAALHRRTPRSSVA